MRRVVHAAIFAAILGLIAAVEEISFVPEGLLLVALGGAYGFFVTGTRTRKDGRRDTRPDELHNGGNYGGGQDDGGGGG
ncbi:MAG: hypothetical protein JW846_08640 [Dehalococcoidia bacterium]|nr:hypothetical protein [Dehalococcoidia bacterium]